MGPAHLPALGPLLRRTRVAVGLTQEALAERSGVSARTISDLERGLARQSRRDTLALLAQALGMSDAERAILEYAARQSSALGAVPPRDISLAQRGRAVVPLVGRARELAVLERHRAGEGPPLLALAGEPGIGKTRLLREAAVRGREHGWAVLEGGCQRRAGQEPYAPILGALLRALTQRAPARRKLDLRGCAWLVRLLPELAEMSVVPVPTWTVAPDQERRLMFAAARLYLANVAGPAGTLLVLDDLQWAGQDALDLIAALARPSDDAAVAEVRVVLAYRSTEVRPTDPLGLLVADFAREELAARIALGPLALEAAGELVAALLADSPDEGDELRGLLIERAGGVPYFLVSCAQAIRGEAYGKAPGDDELPWSVAESIRQRIALVSDAARELLRVVAVSGRQADVLELLAVASGMGLERMTALAALESACHAGLLVEVRRDAYAFAHDLIREVVTEDLGAARSMVLHRRVAEAIEQSPSHPRERRAAELAWHFARGGDPARALPWAMLAGQRAEANYAHTEAERQYRSALESAVAVGDRAREVDAFEALARILHVLGRYDEELLAEDQVVEAYRAAGDTERVARLVERMGEAYGRGARAPEGIVRLRSEIEALGRQGLSAAGMARLHTALAVHYLNSGEWTEQLRAAEQALVFARSADDVLALLKARLLRGAAQVELGYAAEAALGLRELLPEVEATGDLYLTSRVLMHLARAQLATGELDAGRTHASRERDYAERLGDRPLIATADYELGENAYCAGDWPAARLHYQRGMEAFGQVDRASIMVFPRLGLGQLRVAEGGWAEAAHLLGDVVAQARRVSQLEALEQAEATLGEWDLAQGRAESAHARLSPLIGRSSPDEAPIRLLWLWAWACLDEGDLAQAAATVAGATARARAHAHRLALVNTLRVAAMVAARQGQWEEARIALEETLALATPFPYAMGKALAVYGDVHAARGEADDARERYGAALAILGRLGERLYAEPTARALNALHRGTRP